MGSSQSSQLSPESQLKIYRQLENESYELNLNNLNETEKYKRLVQLYNELHSLYSIKSYQVPKVRFVKLKL